METTLLDSLYMAWMDAEAKEQAAKVMLGLRDDIEMRAAYEICVENVEACRGAYFDALGVATRQSAPAFV